MAGVTHPGGAESLQELVTWRARTRPDQELYRFERGGSTADEVLTFADLDRRARAVAAVLADRGARTGDRALVLHGPGLDYPTSFLGCAYAGVIPVPAVAPGAGRSLERLAAIAADASAALALADVVPALDQAETLRQLAWVVPDDVSDAASQPLVDVAPPAGGSSAIAYLQYTSGSTRTPRGVIVTHGSLLANEQAISVACRNDETSVVVGWAPFFHDMGLIANVLQPIYVGCRAVLMSPLSFLRRPARWLHAISAHGGTFSGGPNFAFDLCVDRISEQERTELDLSTWSVAFNAAEPIRRATLERFERTFAPHGFRSSAWFPCYGLAENTLIAAGPVAARIPRILEVDPTELELGRVALRSGGRPLVSCGPAAPGTAVTISGPDGAELGPDLVGDVLLGGTSVASGYWGNPEETEQVFGATTTDGRKHLRTGDLGFVHDGELYVTGRADDVIVVRGRNHYPSDLEAVAEQADPRVRRSCLAAFVAPGPNEQRGGAPGVVLVCEVNGAAGDDELDAVATAVRQAVAAECGLELAAVAFTNHGQVPKTTSGKVRRRAARSAFADGSMPLLHVHHAPDPAPTVTPLAALPARDEASRRAAAADGLRRALAARAGVDPEGLGDDVPLGSLGLDSLATVEVQHALETAWGIVVPFQALVGGATIGDTSAQVAGVAPPPPDPAPSPGHPRAAIAPGGWTDLSRSQLAIWVDQERNPDLPRATLVRAVDLHGLLDVDALQRAFLRLQARHPALTTRFRRGADGLPEQRLGHGALDLRLVEAVDVGELVRAQVATAIDVTREDVVRAHLVRIAADHHTLVLVAHHLVADAWSLSILLRDLDVLYREERLGYSVGLPALATRFEDVVAASDRAGHGDEPVVDLLTEAAVRGTAEPVAVGPPPRSAAAPGPAPAVPVHLDAPLVVNLRERARASGTTLAGVVLGAYALVLGQLAGQRELLVGVATAGRDHARWRDVVGCFVDTLVVPLTVEPSTSVERHLRGVHGRLHQAARSRTSGRPPTSGGSPGEATRAGFAFLQPTAADDPFVAAALGVDGPLRFGGLTARARPVEERTAPFDLSLSIGDVGGALDGWLELDPSAIERDAAVALVARLEAVLADLAACDPRLHVGDLGTGMPGADGLGWWCGDDVDLEPHRDLASLVVDRVRRTPDAVAVAAHDAQLTYAQLDVASRELANRLRALGIGVDDRVGVLVERSSRLPIALLAVLRCGAAYAALDPDDPPERIDELTRSAQVAAIICSDAEITAARDAAGPTVVLLEPGCPSDPRRRRGDPVAAGPASASAYVVFTSGSTGAPKAVVVPHGGIVNRLRWMDAAYRIGPDDHVLHKTPLGFDPSVWELFWPLISGGRLVVAPPGVQRDAAALAQLVAEEEISIVHFVPSFAEAFVDASRRRDLVSLRHVVCSGEVLPPAVVRRFGARSDAEVHNLYGPTEASIDVSSWRCAADDREMPIGRPIANTGLAVVDAALRVQPPYVAGELVIGGAGLARGYLGAPRATADRFTPCPGGAGPGARCYRTGDRVLVDRRGVFRFLGRIDRQVKVHGRRVELGEIEARLVDLPAVREAAVVLRDGGLAAFVAVRRPVDAEAIRAELARRLPRALVPASIDVLEALPRLPNGKLDGRALPAPAARGAGGRAPADAAEQALAIAWREVFGRDDLSVTDSFFDLGGDSILGLRAIASAQRHGIHFTIDELFRHPTIAELAPLASTSDRAKRLVTEPFQLIDPDLRDALADDVEEAYPISAAQQALLFHEAHDPAYEVYVTTLRLHARHDPEAWQAAIDDVVARHAFLRSRFALTAGPTPMQVVARHARVPLELHDLRAQSRTSREEARQRWMAVERTRRFTLARGPLLRVSVHRLGERELDLTLSSFGLDGWCVATVLAEIVERFAHGVAPEPASPPAVGYAEHVALELEAIASRSTSAFWRDLVAGATPVELPRSPARALPRSGERLSGRVSVPFGSELERAARAAASSLGVPLKSVLLAAHLHVMSTVTGAGRIVAGLEVNGRPELPGGDEVVGVFNNIVPLAVDTGDGTWAQLVERTLAAEQELLEHRRYPLVQLERDLGRPNLVRSLFVFTDFHLYRRLGELPGIELLGGDAPDQTYVPLTVHADDDPFGQGLRWLIDHQPDALDERMAVAIADLHVEAVARLAADPWTPHRASGRRPGATASRLAAIDLDTNPWPDGTHPPPGSTGSGLLPDRIRSRLATRPDAVVLRSDHGQVTASQLLRRVHAAAAALLDRGVAPGDLVALHLGRTEALVVAILAAWHVGAAWVGLDDRWPPERTRAALSALAPRVVIHCEADERVLAPTEERRWSTLEVDHAGRCASRRRDGGRAPAPLHPAATAYVLLTSGSTGVPKAVAVPHRAVAHYLGFAARRYRLDGTVPVSTSPAFDLTVTALLGPLLANGVVRLVSSPDVDVLAEVLRDEPCSAVKLTPSHLRMLDAVARGSYADLAPEQFVVGGEALSGDALAPWRRASPLVEIVNEYGPTETTVGCTIGLAGAGTGAVSIGRPLPSTCVHVDGPWGPVPDLVSAPLSVGGAGVADGYLGDPRATAAAFQPDPCRDHPGGRAYATGDLVLVDDGELHYLGRRDRQVKIRGHRVELGEVEREVLGLPGVTGAAVVAEPGPSGTTLVAHVSGTGITPNGISAELAEAVPRHLVPSRVIVVDALPLTANGKVDHERLPRSRSGPSLDELLDRLDQLGDDEVARLLDEARAEVGP